MLSQSDKDSREKKELKAQVMAMATYIDSLRGLRALPLEQGQLPFDPNSEDSQQLTKQMQLGKRLSDAWQEWIGSVLEEGNNFFLEFSMTYSKEKTLQEEIQTLTPNWEANRSQCQAIVFQIIEVEQYGVQKILSENPMKTVDPNMLFILKSTMIWKENMYKEAL
jgi:hypothetical protein